MYNHMILVPVYSALSLCNQHQPIPNFASFFSLAPVTPDPIIIHLNSSSPQCVIPTATHAPASHSLISLLVYMCVKIYTYLPISTHCLPDCRLSLPDDCVQSCLPVLFLLVFGSLPDLYRLMPLWTWLPVLITDLMATFAWLFDTVNSAFNLP